MRSPLSVLIAAILGLGVSAATASAGTLTASTTGATLVVAGAGGANNHTDLTIRPDAPGKIQVASFAGDLVNPGGGSCARDPESPDDTSYVLCTTPTVLQMTYDGAVDELRLIGICFATGTINMGDGANRYSGEADDTCASGTITVNGGSGQDRFVSRDGAGVREIMNGAGGDDDLTGGGGNDEIHGGDGNDNVSGSSGNDTLTGDGGNDVLFGNAGDDTYDGGAGDDKIGESLGGDDDQGADDIRGGEGSDFLNLDGHTGGMTINLDNAPNDGAPGENDNIHSDIESIRGTRMNDTYTGAPGPDTFDGNSGADVVHGGDGNDMLAGGGDGDQVFGDAGNDTLYGSSGDDIVEGGAGTDSLFGDEGGCSQQSCPGGNDQLRSRDGEVDQVNCGAGADVATVDTTDVTAQDGFQACESVDKAGAAAGGTGSNQAGGSAAFKFATTSTLSRAKGFKLRVTCPAACTWTATLVVGASTAKKAKLGRKSVTIGTARGTLLKAGDSRATLKLTKRARAKLKRLKTVTATLKLAVKDPAGKTARQQKTLKLRK